MRTTVERAAPVSKAPALAMAKGFGKYRPMEEQKVRRVEVVEDRTLRELRRIWKNNNYVSVFGSYTILRYVDMLKVAEKLRCSAKDVENFSIAMAEFQGGIDFTDGMGLFLSALINEGKGSDYLVHTNHLSEFPSSLGHGNTKNIVIAGDAGNSTGNEMKGGSILVQGNAGKNTGNKMKGGIITIEGNVAPWTGAGMKGGTIIVNGDADHTLGSYMKGGKIILRGNAGGLLGEDMKAGEIHVWGEIEGIGYPAGGKIYHKGKLIVDK